MVEQQRFPFHWRSILMNLNEERAWNLNEHDIQAYLSALAGLLPVDCSDSNLRRTCMYYHHDHQFVEILKNATHPAYNEYWHICLAKIADILRKAHLFWSKDCAIDSDDFAQIAHMAVAASLHSFVYRSSFSTWLHTVVLYSVKRSIRDSYAQKRAVRPESLDANPEYDVPVPLEQSPEHVANYTLLVLLIRQILEQAGDKRLAHIFQLSVLGDQTTEQIGTCVHLHPSRVRALLAQARFLLQQHPEMKEWLEKVDFASDKV